MSDVTTLPDDELGTVLGGPGDADMMDMDEEEETASSDTPLADSIRSRKLTWLDISCEQDTSETRLHEMPLDIQEWVLKSIWANTAVLEKLAKKDCLKRCVWQHCQSQSAGQWGWDPKGNSPSPKCMIRGNPCIHVDRSTGKLILVPPRERTTEDETELAFWKGTPTDKKGKKKLEV